MSKKPIIVFEGVDFSGKSTQIKIVADFLKKKKIPFVKLREPGGSINSEKIRKLLMNKTSKFNKKTDLLLYLASRSENIQNIIKKNNKKIILIDRFTDSTVAYQHYGMGINLNIINIINNFVTDKIKPRLTFLSIVSKSNIKKRIKLRKNLNRYDLFNISFFLKVQKGYMKLSKNSKKHFIINSNLPIDVNKNILINKISKLL
tara:strand:- start:326 stop:934 length:609 start_codon:yes stop_codon:yes gene_type:complete